MALRKSVSASAPLLMALLYGKKAEIQGVTCLFLIPLGVMPIPSAPAPGIIPRLLAMPPALPPLAPFAPPFPPFLPPFLPGILTSLLASYFDMAFKLCQTAACKYLMFVSVFIDYLPWYLCNVSFDLIFSFLSAVAVASEMLTSQNMKTLLRLNSCLCQRSPVPQCRQ